MAAKEAKDVDVIIPVKKGKTVSLVFIAMLKVYIQQYFLKGLKKRSNINNKDPK